MGRKLKFVMNNKISIITVCFNCADQLEKTILSYMSQTYNDKELIVVDGGSNDRTIEVINKYHENISKWISEPDEGIYDAMNKGLSLAVGEWVNFMNAGDVFTDKNVLTNTFKMQITNNISFIYSDFYEMSGIGNSSVLRYADRKLGMVNHQSSIYRKKLHLTHGFYQYKRPYKVYDLMFFLSIPEEEFLKAQYPISVSDNTGVSNNKTWCFEQAHCLRAAYGIISIHQAYKRYLCQCINNAMPKSLKFFIDKYVRRNKTQC